MLILILILAVAGAAAVVVALRADSRDSGSLKDKVSSMPASSLPRPEPEVPMHVIQKEPKPAKPNPFAKLGEMFKKKK